MSVGPAGSEEHHFRQIIPGDVVSVRGKLCDVLEDFDYIVSSDTPIQVRWEKTISVLVSTILDCEGGVSADATRTLRLHLPQSPKAQPTSWNLQKYSASVQQGRADTDSIS